MTPEYWMAGAVLVTLLCLRFVLRTSRPFFVARFHRPEKRAIDARLLSGAVLFGVGWGSYGSCPGPALTAPICGNADTVLFAAAMLAGMGLASRAPFPMSSPPVGGPAR